MNETKFLKAVRGMARCLYCTLDVDGCPTLLPREGRGITAFIDDKLFEGKVMVLRGPNKTRVEIPVNFCPMCGRDLKKGGK